MSNFLSFLHSFLCLEVYCIIVWFQMYHTSIGHTEGDLTYVQFLITDAAVYVLTPGIKTRYHRHSTVKYRELDYISVSEKAGESIICADGEQKVCYFGIGLKVKGSALVILGEEGIKMHYPTLVYHSAKLNAGS